MRIEPKGCRPLWHASLPYPTSLRSRVLKLQKPGARTTLKELLVLDRDLGDWYASALAKLMRANGHHRPDLIANHGQTVSHFPEPGGKGMTLQMGDPSRIAAATGITVVSNFRRGDLSVGGQGAPLVPHYHRLLARSLRDGTSGIAIHNLGGISNFSYMAPDGEIIAFDTGPGNVWIDASAEEFSGGRMKMDRGGRIASQGRADHQAVKKILSLSYFRKAPPKSTGRDEFPFSMLKKATRARGADLVATATQITIDSMAVAYRKWIIDKGYPLSRVYLCGGGARNPRLVKGLGEKLGVPTQPLSVAGFDEQYTEAEAFAVLGVMSLRGQALGGSWTGARSFGPPGHLVPARNWEELLFKIGRF